MRLAVNNVVHLTDGEVRDRFVVREAELDELLVHLREDDPPRHVLVIGPRGMGKSLLLRRVTVMVNDEPELQARWLPVLMPEELYEVTSIADLWMAALDQLAIQTGDEGLRSQYDALMEEPDLGRVASLALQRLLEGARRSGRKVLLLAENMHMVFEDQVNDDAGWALRQVLQNEPDMLLMASAVTTFRQVEDSNEALFGFFHRVELQPLSDPEVARLWRDVTSVDLPAGRVAAVRILTGGNPRLVTILAGFARDPELRHLRQELEALIDEYTPYFKANIEALPATERKVFVTLADIWAPASAAEVAKRARMSSSQVSSLLQRLARRGAVDVLGSGRSRRYELTERLYNLYHLLRRPDGDGRVRALFDILTHLYDPLELDARVFPQLVERIGVIDDDREMDVKMVSLLEEHLTELGAWDALNLYEAEARLPHLEALIEAQRAEFGDDDVRTLLTRVLIAICRGRIDPQAVIAECETIVADCERTLDQTHINTLLARGLLAHFTAAAGSASTALRLYRELLPVVEDAGGTSSAAALQLALQLRGHMAALLTMVGQPTEAVLLLEELIAESKVRFGAHETMTLYLAYMQVWCLRRAGETNRARSAARALADSVRESKEIAVERLRKAVPALVALLDLDEERARGQATPRELREVHDLVGTEGLGVQVQTPTPKVDAER